MDSLLLRILFLSVLCVGLAGNTGDEADEEDTVLSEQEVGAEDIALPIQFSQLKSLQRFPIPNRIVMNSAFNPFRVYQGKPLEELLATKALLQKNNFQEFLKFMETHHEHTEIQRMTPFSEQSTMFRLVDLTARLSDSASLKIEPAPAKLKIPGLVLNEEEYEFNEGFQFQHSVPPDRRVGYLKAGCTGTLIADHVVMTAAHCVYDTVSNNWQSWENMKFAPGFDSSAPNGWMTPRAAVIPTAYRDQSKWSEWNDFALIAYSDSKYVGYFGFGYNIGECSAYLTHKGYPAEKSGQQWMDKCYPTYCNSATLMCHRCAINVGDSGGPYWDAGNHVVAVQSGHCADGSCDNTAYNLNQWSFNLALSWRNQFN